MKVYSIVRIGSEYIVQAGENSVLKVASRRIALRVVSDAAELLAIQLAPQLPGQDAPSIVCDRAGMPGPAGLAPEAGVMADPAGVIPDRSEVP